MSSARAFWAFAGALLPLMVLDRWGSAAWLEPVSRAALAWMAVVLVAGAPGESRTADRTGWLLLAPLLIACAAVDRGLGQSSALLLGIVALGVLVALVAAEAGRRLTHPGAGARAKWLWTAGWWAWLLGAPALWVAQQRAGAELAGSWLAAAPLVRLGEWARIGELHGVGWSEVARGIGLAGAPLLLWALVCGAVAGGAPGTARSDAAGGGRRGRGVGASLLGACLVAGLADSALAQESRLARVSVAVEGPLEGLEFEVPGGGLTRYAVDLDAGERRELELFVPVRSALDVSLGAPPAATARGGRGGGRVGAVGWAPEPLGESFWKALPVELRTRPRPVPVDWRSAAPGWLLAGLVGLFLPGWWLARRGQRGAGRAVGALGLLAAGAVWPRLAAEPGAVAVEVIEADLRGEGAGLRIRSAAWLELSSAQLLGQGRLETVPEGAELRIDGVVDPATGRVELVATAPGSVLHWMMPIGSGTLAELTERFGASGVATAPVGGPQRRAAFRRVGGVDRTVSIADLPPWLVSGLPAGLPVAFWVEPGIGTQRRFVRLMGLGVGGK